MKYFRILYKVGQSSIRMDPDIDQAFDFIFFQDLEKLPCFFLSKTDPEFFHRILQNRFPTLE
jgi:hypothetical protein